MEDWKKIKKEKLFPKRWSKFYLDELVNLANFIQSKLCLFVFCLGLHKFLDFVSTLREYPPTPEKKIVSFTLQLKYSYEIINDPDDSWMFLDRVATQRLSQIRLTLPPSKVKNIRWKIKQSVI